MKNTRMLGAVSACVLLSLTTTTNGAVLALEGRLPLTPNGTDYQAYYDPNLDITWSANSAINGLDTWDNQDAWVSSLTIGGVSGWRIPSADVNGDGTIEDCLGGGVTNCDDNEMGYLFWEEGINTDATGPFTFVESDLYYSSTAFASNPDEVWGLDFDIDGTQITLDKSVPRYVWAVHSGDVTAVPIPPALWLFGSGLLGLLGVVMKKS